VTAALDAESPLGKALIARRYRFSSGLKAILVRDPSAPIVSYQTWYSVGSRDEQPGATGMAHLFEHLMFNQTRSLEPGEFDRLIERTGGDSNAATWVDWTHYRSSVPSSHLELAVKLESDRMHNLVLEEKQIETEREVVMNERLERVEDDVDGFLDEELHRLAYTSHPYGWPTIGWMEDIRSLSPAAIREFYQRYYAPNNACLVIVGEFEERAALDLVDRYYGDIEPSQIPRPGGEPEPMQTAERAADFAKPVAAPRLVAGYKGPGQTDPDWIAMELLSAVLALGPSSRLYRRLVIDRELASDVDCSIAPFRDPCLFRIGVNGARGVDVAAIVSEIDKILSELAESGVGDAELEKARSGTETGLWAELETADGKGEALGHYETTVGDFRELMTAAKRVQSLDAGAVSAAAARYLTPSARSIVMALPERPGGATPGEADG